jgi:transcriptional regulator with XRE-family HTH domain
MTSPPRSANRWVTVLDGVRLRQLRSQRGLSPAELASQAGLGRSTVMRLERHPRPSCRTRTLARLAAALGLPPGRLDRSQPPWPDASVHLANPPLTVRSGARILTTIRF